MSVTLTKALAEHRQACASIYSDWKAAVEWMPNLHSRETDLSYIGFLVDQEQVYIAVENNEVLGFVAESGGMVNFLYLANANRCKGIGAQLLARTKTQSEGGLQLWTFQKNTRAIAFYKANGFTEVQRTDGAENEEQLPDVLLSWNMV